MQRNIHVKLAYIFFFFLETEHHIKKMLFGNFLSHILH